MIVSQLQLNLADALLSWADEIRKDGSRLAVANAEELQASIASLREKYPTFQYQWMRLERVLAEMPEFAGEEAL